MPKHGSTGLERIVHAGRFSLFGLRAAWRHEAAFRQELLLSLLLLASAFAAGVPVAHLLLLCAACLALLACELLNSAIEAVVDRIGHERHELSGRAKDLGSAAVLAILLALLLFWGWMVAGALGFR